MERDIILEKVEKIISERLEDFRKKNPNFTYPQYYSMVDELFKDLDKQLRSWGVDRNSDLYFEVFTDVYKHIAMKFLDKYYFSR